MLSVDASSSKLSAISASFSATSALENTFNAEIAEVYAENAEKISAKRANRQDELTLLAFSNAESG